MPARSLQGFAGYISLGYLDFGVIVRDPLIHDAQRICYVIPFYVLVKPSRVIRPFIFPHFAAKRDKLRIFESNVQIVHDLLTATIVRSLGVILGQLPDRVRIAIISAASHVNLCNLGLSSRLSPSIQQGIVAAIIAPRPVR